MSIKTFIAAITMLPLVALAQEEREVDSLKQMLAKAFTLPEGTGKDTAVARAAIEISRLSSHDPDSSFKYALTALVFGSKAKHNHIMAKADHQAGNAFSFKGEPDSAMKYYNMGLKALNLAKFSSDKAAHKQKAKLYDAIGQTYWGQAKFAQALEYFFASLKLEELIGRKKGIAHELSNIGLVYSSQNKHKKAIEYYRKCLAIEREAGMKKEMPISLGNLGNIFSEIGQYDSAAVYLGQALEMNRKNGSEVGMAYNLSNIGNLFYIRGIEKEKQGDNVSARKDFIQSLGYFEEGVAISRKINNGDIRSITEANYGQLLMVLGRDREAEVQLKKAYELTLAIQKLDLLKEICNNLYSLLEKNGKYKDALHYHKQLAWINDTLALKENIVKQTRLEMQYDFDKKAAAEALQKQKEEDQRQAEDKKQKLILVFVSFILLLSLLFSVHFFRSLRHSKEQNRLIKEQKALVELKQKEVMDSIRYAKRIQSAHLPSENYFTKMFARFRK